MRMIKGMLALALATLLVACGSGGCDAGSSPIAGTSSCSTTTTTTTPSATAVDVLSSSPQVGTGGEQITISAIVKGAGNVSLADTAVSFSTTSGILTSTSAKTDSAGVATAVLSAGANKLNRNLTVTVTSGSASGSVVIQVTGTALQTAGAPTVGLGKTAKLSVKAVDSKNAVIAGLPITVSSLLRNGLSATAVTTDGQGNATVDYTATVSGADQVTFSGGGTSVAASVTISGEDFVFVSPSPSALVPVGTSQAISVQYKVGGAPVAGRTVNFAATAGTFTSSTAVTDASGIATTQITSSSASPATVSASLQGAVSALATLPIEFVALTPATLVLQVTPTAVGPNVSGSTTRQAQVIATVRDAQLNPVKGVAVNFNRLVDPSGGNLSQATAVTDSSGQASVNYIPGSLTTSSNGVQLRAFVATAPAVLGDATLTVNQSSLFIALGTGNTITNLDQNTYNKEWTIYVTDSNGVAVPNVTLTIKVLPVKYGKGRLTFGAANPALGLSAGWRVDPTTYSECDNEDANYNGTIDKVPVDEDFNQSNTLEPGNVISVFTGVGPGTITTNSEGRATVSLRYAESYVPWVKVRLRAEAVVTGTESSKETEFWVIGRADDLTDATILPAGYVSPFGENTCSVKN